MEHKFVNKKLEDFLREGYKVLWPIRIVSLDKYDDLVVQYHDTGCIEELDSETKKEFEKYYSIFRKNGYIGIIVYAVLQKSEEKIPISLSGNSAQDLYKIIGKGKDFGEEIIQFHKQIRSMKTISSMKEFLDIPITLFEQLFPINKLQDGEIPASSFWKSCKHLQSNLAIDDIQIFKSIYSILFEHCFSQLNAYGIIQNGWISKLRKDRVSFEHRIYEPQIAFHFIEKGYDLEFTDDKSIPDLRIKCRDYDLYIECKCKVSTKISSVSSILDTFHDAVGQIPQKAFGIVCIEIIPSEKTIKELEDKLIEELAVINESGKKVCQIIITWLDRDSINSYFNGKPVETKEAHSYVIRRHSKIIHNEKYVLPELKTFEGQTIHFIDAPLIKQVRIDNTLRSEDWTKLTHYSLDGTKYIGDKWLSWGPEISIEGKNDIE